MKETVYITAHWNSYSKEFSYSARGYAPSSGSGDILLEAREIEFDSPNDSILRLRCAEALKDKKNKILADAHVEAKEVEEELQTMLALEDKSATKEDDDIPY